MESHTCCGVKNNRPPPPSTPAGSAQKVFKTFWIKCNWQCFRTWIQQQILAFVFSVGDHVRFWGGRKTSYAEGTRVSNILIGIKKGCCLFRTQQTLCLFILFYFIFFFQKKFAFKNVLVKKRKKISSNSSVEGSKPQKKSKVGEDGQPKKRG